MPPPPLPLPPHVCVMCLSFHLYQAHFCKDPLASLHPCLLPWESFGCVVYSSAWVGCVYPDVMCVSSAFGPSGIVTFYKFWRAVATPLSFISKSGARRGAARLSGRFLVCGRDDADAGDAVVPR